MKKRLLFIVIAVVALAVAAFALGCGEDDKPGTATRYSVSAEYNAERGSVTVADKDGNAKEAFGKGEEAVVTPVPTGENEVLSFKVDGQEKQLDGGAYRFNVTKNVKIEVEFGIPTYTVTAVFDPSRGSVSIEDENGNAKTTFAKGDTVVVKPVSGGEYPLVSFKVNGVKAELNSGAYTFTVTGETKIEAVFGIGEMTQSVLDASNASVLIEGTCAHSEDGSADTVNSVKTVFGVDEIYIEEKTASGVVTYADVYKNEGGKLAQLKRTIDNTVESDISNEDFADYYNPFALLSPADFEPTDKADVLKISDKDKAKAAAMAITGWREKIGLFEVKIAGGKITEIHIETEEGAMVDGVAYHSDYKFTLSGHGTTEVDAALTKQYETRAEHETLRKALTDMALSKNYTVSVSDVMGGAEDVNYDVYVTETAIYDDCPGYYNGWVLSEGHVYPFNRSVDEKTGEATITLYDALNNITNIVAVRAAFIGYAPELFELTDKDANGSVYTLRNNELAGEIFPEFGDGVDRMKYFGFAIDGQILLDENDKLLGVRFDYYMYGYVGSITLTYSNVDTTTLPAYLDFTDVVKVSVFDPYVGTYTDDTHTVVINAEDGITIDGVITTVKSYDREYGVFTVDCDGTELYVGKKSSAQLLVYNESYTICYELLLQNIAPVEIPEVFAGKWNGKFYDETSTVATDIAYDSTADTLSFKLGDKNCSIAGDGATELATVSLVGMEDYPLVFVRGEPVNGKDCEIIPIKYTGAYELTLTVGDEKVQYLLFIYEDSIEYSTTEPLPSQVVITSSRVILDGVALDVLSYGEKEGLICYDAGSGLTYNLVNIGQGKEIDVLTFKGAERLYDTYFFTQKDAEFVAVPEQFIGTWTGFVGETLTDYTLVATVDSVKITRSAGGQTAEFDAVVKKVETVTSFGAEFCEMTIVANGVEYTVTETGEAGRIRLADKASLSVSLEKQSGGQPSGEIPEKFYGDFLSTAGTEMICIDASGITYAMIGGVEAEVGSCVYDGTEGYFTVTLDGVEFTVMDAAYDEPISKIMIYNNNDMSQRYTLTRYVAPQA